MAGRFPMVKNDEEEIERFIFDGWSFRVKTVSGKRYITRRKGKKERGMGSFSDELWRLISDTLKGEDIRVSAESSESVHVHQESDVQEVFLDSRAHAHKLLEAGVLSDKGVYMWSNCVHKDEEGYCLFWNWGERPGFFRFSDELSLDLYTRKVVYLNGVESSRWVFSASPWYCQSCPVFESVLTIWNSAVVASRARNGTRG